MPPHKDDILNSVQKMMQEDQGRKTPFKDNRPGKKWFEVRND